MTTATLDPRFSDPSAEATSWADAQRELEQAKAYWFTTVRPDGRPHVTTVAAVWANDAVYVTTSVDEQKAKNLVDNQHCVITTGCNTFEGLDVVVEADAVVETDAARLQAMADAYRAKYDDLFPYEVRDGRLYMAVAPVEGEPGELVAYRLRATKAFGFGKGPFSQTRWTF
jgi:general stress protein 26